jgi:hypothetical protein
MAGLAAGRTAGKDCLKIRLEPRAVPFRIKTLNATSARNPYCAVAHVVFGAVVLARHKMWA